MAKTEFGVNHPLAVKVWSKKLMTEAIANTWIGKFIGNSKDSLIYRKDEISKNAGESPGWRYWRAVCERQKPHLSL